MRGTIAILLCTLPFVLCFSKFLGSASALRRAVDDPSIPSFQTKWFTQQVDHYGWANSQATYQQRWLVNDEHWDGKGPILFYTGNEGDIELFWNNTGFVTKTLAKQFKGLVVFAEHRYYGQSMPFGKDSYKLDKVVFLSSQQALADYSVLISHIRDTYDTHDTALISFGGSYGGMLSAWFRMKYPTVVDGAIAASAPILQFYNTGVSFDIFNEIVTTDFAEAKEGCSSAIEEAFNEINQLSLSPDGLTYLSKTFSTCSPLPNGAALIGWMNNALSYMAMADYPYSSSFLGSMPGYPINVSCDNWSQAKEEGKNNLKAVGEIMSVFYNYTGQAGDCYDLSGGPPGLDANGWEYQTCTEMVMPMSSGGPKDMFPNQPWNLTSWTSYCQTTWGATPRPNWVTEYYGGELLPSGQNNLIGSNIFFSNGRLDPWRGGGVTESPSPSMITAIIEGGAHHLDLREPNERDPESVTSVRRQEMKYIAKWIEEGRQRRAPKL